jgi:hypothetical protein
MLLENAATRRLENLAKMQCSFRLDQNPHCGLSIS